MLSQSLTCFVAQDHLIEIIKVVVVIAGRAQNLKGQISDDGWRSVVQEEELPLQAVSRGKLTLTRVHDGHLPDQLRRLQSTSAHEY